MTQPAALHPSSFYCVPTRLGGTFEPDTALTGAVPIVQYRPIVGVTRARWRLKADQGGTFACSFASPPVADVMTDYVTPATVSVAVVANTEVLLEVEPKGEAFAKLVFTPSGNGSLTYCDECGL
jgi:hypothetical protein